MNQDKPAHEEDKKRVREPEYGHGYPRWINWQYKHNYRQIESVILTNEFEVLGNWKDNYWNQQENYKRKQME